MSTQYDDTAGLPIVDIDAAIAKELVEQEGLDIEDVWDLRRARAKWCPKLKKVVFPKDF